MDHKTKIAQLEKEIQINHAIMTEELGSIGEVVFRNGPPVPTEAIAPLLADCNDINNRIGRLTDEKRRIGEIIDRQGELKLLSENRQQEIKTLLQDNNPHFERIAERAFEVSTRPAGVDEPFREMLAPIQTLISELQEIDRDIAQVETDIETKSFLEKIVLRGRLIFLRNNKANKIGSLPKLYRKAGEDLCANDFLDTTNDPGLSEAAAPFRANKARIQALEEQLAQLNSENSELTNELTVLGQGKRSNRRVAEIENEVADASRTIGGLYEQIGRKSVEAMPHDESGPADLGEAIAAIRALETENAAKIDNIERLRAAIEIERLTKAIDSMEKSISSIQELIQKKQQEIHDIEESIAETKTRKSALIAKRGDETDL